jgi:pyridoxamine 5'-phosphate oxidase
MMAPWREPLARALHRNRSLVYSRYIQLATVRGDGRPANRTVVFRGFRQGTDDLQLVSDGRSQKLVQLAGCAAAEACWYFPKTREQFRLAGQIAVIVSQTADPTLSLARWQMWQQLSEAARQQFTWPDPGQPQLEGADFCQPSPAEPPDWFCLLLLQIDQVDHLNLRADPQQRSSFQRRADSWTQVNLNP